MKRAQLRSFYTTHRRDVLLSGISVFAVAIVGSLLMFTKAAVSVVATETESGTRSTQAAQVNDSTASGGKAVKFTAPALVSSTGCPGKPDATCTGVPAGTKLTVVNGDQTYSTDGQIISGLDIHGYVRVTGKNITIKNSIIRGGSAPCTSTNSQNSAAIWVMDQQGAVNFTLQDSEINPSDATACLDGAWLANTTFERVNIHGSVDGVKAYNNTTIKDSYIHDMAYFTSDPNQNGGPTHNDGVQTYECNSHILVQHNNIDLSTTDGNATYQITQNAGTPCSDIVIDGNWLDGGGCTINVSHDVLASLTGVSITNNRFGRHQGFSGCTVLLSTKSTLTAYSGNVWDDTGQDVPPPQVHD